MKKPNIITDDTECKELLMRHGVLADMKPGEGRDTAMKIWADDSAYYMGVYCTHPGDTGYMVLVMDKKKFTFEEAAAICLDVYNTPRAPDADASKDIMTAGPGPKEAARSN